MIRTPLGQYINENQIYNIHLVGDGYIVQSGSPPKIIQTIPDTKFWLQVTYLDNSKQKISKEYETKEEAQKELDKMMDYAPDTISKEWKLTQQDIARNKLIVRKQDDNNENWKAIYLHFVKWAVVNSGNTSYYETFEEAFKEFDKIII